MSESYYADLALAAIAGLILLGILGMGLYDSFQCDRSKLKPYMIWMAVLFGVFVPITLFSDSSLDPRFEDFNAAFLIWLEIGMTFGFLFLVDDLYARRDARRAARKAKYGVKVTKRPPGFLSKEDLQRSALVTPAPRGDSTFKGGAITAEFEVIPPEELRRMTEDKEPLPPVPYVWSWRVIRKRVRNAFTAKRGSRGKLPNGLKLSLWSTFFRPSPIEAAPRGPRPLDDDGRPIIVPLPMPWRLLQRGKRLRWYENERKSVRDTVDPIIVPLHFPFSIPGTTVRALQQRIRRILRRGSPTLN